VGIEDYTIHDARHSWAVRARRAGVDFEVIARQLGHRSTAQAVNVYARFRPTDQDMKWTDDTPVAVNHPVTPTPVAIYAIGSG